MGELMETLASTDPDLLAYVDARSTGKDARAS